MFQRKRILRVGRDFGIHNVSVTVKSGAICLEGLSAGG